MYRNASAVSPLLPPSFAAIVVQPALAAAKTRESGSSLGSLIRKIIRVLDTIEFAYAWMRPFVVAQFPTHRRILFEKFSSPRVGKSSSRSLSCQ